MARDATVPAVAVPQRRCCAGSFALRDQFQSASARAIEFAQRVEFIFDRKPEGAQTLSCNNVREHEARHDGCRVTRVVPQTSAAVADRLIARAAS